MKEKSMEVLEISCLRQIDGIDFSKTLLAWYHKNKRSLPWREEPLPYHVWLSEIMLQQTRVEAVKEYYKRFLKKLPDIKSLAEVEDEVLHKLWEGLGYYNRAKNLKKAANLVMEEYGGSLPSSYEELLKLPGIGPYTAGAIASIAFLEAVPAVDGNVMRVVSRLTGDFEDITESVTKKRVEETVREWIPKEEVNHFNQALMELGALICIPNGKPKCEVCPVSGLCFAHKEGRQMELPIKKRKKERKKEQRTVLIFKNKKEEFYLRKRKENGLLSGLWEFPSLRGSFTKKELERKLKEEGVVFYKIEELKGAKHIFTHIEWDMRAFQIFLEEEDSLLLFWDEDKRKDSTKTMSNYLEEAWNDRGEEEKRKIRAWANFLEIKEKYSIPSAFHIFLKQIF